MAKRILVVLAVVMFVFAGLALFRGNALVVAERERMAADNAARERQPGGSGFVEINPDIGKLQGCQLILNGVISRQTIPAFQINSLTHLLLRLNYRAY